MNITVKKSALDKFMSRLAENRTGNSMVHNTIMQDEVDEPIVPVPQMSVQLSVDAPPVDDPEYMPASAEELSRASSVISSEVPDDQIDFFYRQLHRLLDASLDKHKEALGDAINEETTFRVKVRNLLEQIDDDFDDEDEDDNFDYEDKDYDDDLGKSLSIENKVESALDAIQDYFHDGDTFEKLTSKGLSLI